MNKDGTIVATFLLLGLVQYKHLGVQSTDLDSFRHLSITSSVPCSDNHERDMYGPRGGIRTQKPTYRLENGYSIQLSYTRVYLEEDIRFERMDGY